MGLFRKSKEEKLAKLKENQSIRNGKDLKKLLSNFYNTPDKNSLTIPDFVEEYRHWKRD